MCRDPFAVCVRGSRSYAYFLFAHNGLLRTGPRDRLVSGDVQLERVHPLAQQASARARHLVHTVHDQRNGLAVDVHAALVAEIAGVGQLGAGGQQSRPRCVPRVDLVPDHDVEAWLGRAAAHARREARFEYDPGVAPGLERVLLGGDIARFGDVGFVQKRQVRVTVHQARDDRVPRHVDAPSGAESAPGLRHQLSNPVTSNQHIGRECRLSGSVPDGSALE